MDRYAFEAHVTRVSPVGMTARGLRMDIAFAGDITEGELAGCTIEGIDYVLRRSDGVAVVDARELILDRGRVVASVRAEGYIVPPVRMPEPSAITSPDVEWPDVDLPMHGAAFLETGDDRIADAAATVYGFTGTVNMRTGVLLGSARSLAAARLTEPVARD